jgi:hypothetical protein
VTMANIAPLVSSTARGSFDGRISTQWPCMQASSSLGSPS